MNLNEQRRKPALGISLGANVGDREGLRDGSSEVKCLN